MADAADARSPPPQWRDSDLRRAGPGTSAAITSSDIALTSITIGATSHSWLLALKDVSHLPATPNRPRFASRLSIARMDLFAGLPAADLTMLENRLPVVRWPRGGEIPEPLLRPDHLFAVRAGRIAIFESTAAGHEVMTAILDEGNVYSTLGSATEPMIAALDDAAVSPLSGPVARGAHVALPAPWPQPGPGRCQSARPP